MAKSSLFWEFVRKATHLGGLSIVVAYTLLLNFFSAHVAILVLTALLLILLEIEYFRLEHRSRLVAAFDGMVRKHEMDHISGAGFLVISCIISFAAFDYWIATMALFMTVFGDIFAALVGKAFGKTKITKNKSYVGTLAGFAANVIVGIMILPEFLYLGISMAIVATITEVITNKLDDNLTVPLFAGFAGQMIFLYFDLALPPIDFTFLGFF